MRKTIFITLLFQFTIYNSNAQVALLDIAKNSHKGYKGDWMISHEKYNAAVYRSSDNKDLILDNGLLRRTFRLSPNLTCTDFTNLSSGQQLLRTVGPEAKIILNGKKYNIGGLYGQKERAYLLNDWVDNLKSGSADFQYRSFSISPITPYVNWLTHSSSWALNDKQPKGKMLTLTFSSDQAVLYGVKVSVHYELYDNIPLLCKWVSIENKGSATFTVNQVVNEVVAIHEEESSVAGNAKLIKTQHGLYIESNYAFNNSMNARLSDQTTHWTTDSSYTSQVNYDFNTPCILEVYPDKGIGIRLGPGQQFKSIRTNELLLDSYDRDRNGMAQRLMYKTIAPWATQNPIFMHLISTDPRVVKNAIDQCAVTGYEGIILSFGSGINMEDLSEFNISKIKELADYAHHRNVLLGGYSLFSSRKINDNEDVIDPKSGKADLHALFGAAPCLASKWGLNYLNTIKTFIKKTGLDIFENDGPYPGDVCASRKHPGHQGLADSQWAQMELQKGLYRWCSENGIYVNAPDWYFLDGTNKIALGYREVNFSLPRAQQMILNRQNIYDGTWEKMPSMSWGFVPLSEYHGGGEAATLEPLHDHLDAYEQLMMQYYGAGIQACYRGPRLYDTDDTKALVVKTINWYKRYRTILNSPIIHLRRPDGRDWDGILHVDPDGTTKGLAMLYNPLDAEIIRKIRIPLYYTGITKTVQIAERGTDFHEHKLDNYQNLELEVKLPKNGYTWLLFK